MWAKPYKDMGKELRGRTPLFWENQSLREHPMHDYSAVGGELEEHKLPSIPTFNFFSLSLL
jgi:hypothetical protein